MTQDIIWREAWNFDQQDQISLANMIDCQAANDGKTVQEPTEDCDINVLMKRMGVKDGSQLPNWNTARDMYDVDLTQMPEDPTVINNIIHTGKLKFMQLPANIRARFDNEPGELFKWLNNKDNFEEAVKMGLLAPDPTPPEPVSVRVIPPETA